jgi:hypothetical protein
MPCPPAFGGETLYFTQPYYGPEGDRTPYLFHAMEALYQVSYRPIIRLGKNELMAQKPYFILPITCPPLVEANGPQNYILSKIS